MARTSIIIPSSGSIDMYDDVSTPLTFNIADIRNPDKRNANFSKTIKIPGTANNNKLFGHIFNVNVTALTFNPNRKTQCKLLIDDEEQLSGFLKLDNITVTDNYQIEYSCTIMGNVGNPFNEMGNSLLTDLDFSSGDHLYTYDVQTASWANDFTDYYCYPYIDYGFNSDLDEVDVEDLLPAIFLKAYVLKIFESIGYTYTSTFFDSTFFENLIIPSNGGRLVMPDSEIVPYLFVSDVNNVSSGSILNSGGLYTFSPFTIIYDQEISDGGMNYDEVTGEWTITKAGYYSCNASAYATINASSPIEIHFFVRLQHKPFGSGSYNLLTIGDGVRIDTFTYKRAEATATNIFFNVGDKIRVNTFYNSTGVNYGPGITGNVSVNQGTFYNKVVNSGLIEGDNVLLSNSVPRKIKQKELILNIIKMFNLYVDIDTNNPKNLIIETRDDFYSSGDIVDWTDKLDYSTPIEYQPMGALEFKELIYTYTDDSDFYNKKYKDTYQETYGRYRAINDNEFLTSINENKVIFSPTPLVGDDTSDRVIPRIWEVDSNNQIVAKAFNIRILYRGGIKDTAQAYNYNGRYSGGHSLTQYLYAGHLDDTVNPTLDLNFGVPQEIYYNTVKYTNNNVFNRFHLSFFEDITDVDSRIVTANFYLNKGDISTLDFRNKFYFDGNYYRLNKIMDYDPLKHEVTKCEFLKIKNPNVFASTQTSINGGFFLNYEDGYPIITSRL